MSNPHSPANANPPNFRGRDAAMQSVFDEPFAVTRSDQPSVIDRDTACPNCHYNLRGGLAGSPCPECGYRFDAGYAQWVEARFANASKATGYLVVLAAMAVAGTLAIAGTLLGSLMTFVGFGALSMVVFGPTLEEVMKVFGVVMILKCRPWLLPNRAAVILAATAGALGFAIIENLMYLHLYIDDPSPVIIAWRWTVCTALHVAATSITAIGLARLWKHAATRFEPVQLAMALPYLIIAIALHGSYNAFALLLELTDVFY